MVDRVAATRIQLSPRSEVVHVSRGRTALGLDRQGNVHADEPRQGLYVHQTRMLSRYGWTIDGEEPRLSVQSAVEQHSWLAYYFVAPKNCKDTPTGECNPLQQTIELRVARVVGEGMHEDVELVNHTQIATTVTLVLEADADFAAREEVRKGRKQHGKLPKTWERVAEREWRWSFDYKAEHEYEHQGEKGVARLHRGISLRLRADSEATHAGRKVSFRIELAPHAHWNACLIWTPEVDGHVMPVEEEHNALVGSSGEYSRKRERFLASATRLRTTADDDLTARVQRVLDRARLDVAALRMDDLDRGEHEWTLAAGVPTYMALFGRDMLGAAWQASLLSVDMTRGALAILGDRTAHDENPWRDAQPGRMLHEQHTDPLSVLNYTPRGRYFGSVTTPFLYPICVSELWHWTGDLDLVRPFVKPALDGLAWADEYSLDRKTGFYVYDTLSEDGPKNQAWKDSDDAIVYPDGSQVPDPLGTCEMQAFAYAAKLHFAEVLFWLGDRHDARRLFEEAEALKRRFNERFWMEDEGFVAMAIDGDGRVVKTIASDPGHCVTAGILPAERAARVVERLLEPDMFSGWGVRTLSTKHPAYNPFAYHRGTVWPVENAGFVLGMARYGLHAPMWRLARALFETAALFEYDRLPEVFGGHARDARHPFPCLYEKADSPQAWSASAPILMLQSMVGVYPYAPLHLLLVDPHLPPWMSDITIEKLRVGEACVDLRFVRDESGETRYEVLAREGKLHVVRQPSPWSLTAGWAERVKDALESLLPRK